MYLNTSGSREMSIHVFGGILKVIFFCTGTDFSECDNDRIKLTMSDKSDPNIANGDHQFRIPK